MAADVGLSRISWLVNVVASKYSSNRPLPNKPRSLGPSLRLARRINHWISLVRSTMSSQPIPYTRRSSRLDPAVTKNTALFFCINKKKKKKKLYRGETYFVKAPLTRLISRYCPFIQVGNNSDISAWISRLSFSSFSFLWMNEMDEWI
jgi:hypothetical protein